MLLNLLKVGNVSILIFRHTYIASFHQNPIPGILSLGALPFIKHFLLIPVVLFWIVEVAVAA